MTSPDQCDEFDAFYADARDQLLVETFALTGDLSAGRSAVRDAFAMTWHHWRKATRKDDPYNWMRPLAWRLAQRHHQTHIWQRDKALPEWARPILGALAALTPRQRKALVLAYLTSLDEVELTRAVGLQADAVVRELALAITSFQTALDVPEDQIGATLESLHAVTSTVSWPRATLVRRAGAARRRTLSAAGAAAAAALLVVSGSFVTSGEHAVASLDLGRFTTGTADTSAPLQEAPTLLESAELLTTDAVQAIAPGLTWQETLTTDNSGKDPVLAPCQTERFADLSGIDTYVRQFDTTDPGRRRAQVLEAVELSRNVEAATRTYERVLRTYASCTQPRTQLLASNDIAGVGAEAVQFRFRTWTSKPTHFTVNVTRSGRVTLTTVDIVANLKKNPTPAVSAGVLAAALTAQCSSDLVEECAATPVVTPRDPLSSGKPRGLLKEVDLPPVTAVKGSWLGTSTAPLQTMLSPARCATTSFTRPGFTAARSRTFVFPKMKKDRAFGLTQGVAKADASFGKSFVTSVRQRIADCEDSEPGTRVSELHTSDSKKKSLSVWQLSIEVTDQRNTEFLLAVLRHGNRVSQIGFMPSETSTMTPEDFIALAQRAQQRLPNYRRPAAS